MSAELERRYRRLLAWYPAEYRLVYEDEMLGVLLAGKRAKQRFPGFREAADLLLSAAWMRLAPRGAGATDSRWTDAAAVLGVLAPILLLAKHVRPVASDLGWFFRGVDTTPMAQPTTTWFRIAGWIAVTVAVLCGWRLAAATGAWAAVLGEAIIFTLRHSAGSTTLVQASWPLLLTVVVAIAVSVPGGPRRGTSVLGWRRAALFGAAGAVAASAPMAVPFLATVVQSGESSGTIVTSDTPFVIGAAIDQRLVALVALLTYAVVSAMIVAAIAGISPPIRRRVVTLLAPTMTLLLVIELRFDDALSGAIYVRPPLLAGPFLWPLLIGAPLLVLLASLSIVRRRDRTERHAQLGSATD